MIARLLDLKDQWDRYDTLVHEPADKTVDQQAG